MTYQKNNRRIRIVYLVLFYQHCLVLSLIHYSFVNFGNTVHSWYTFLTVFISYQINISVLPVVLTIPNAVSSLETIYVYTGNNKEDPRTSGPACQESPQAEDDGSLKLLDDLDYQDQGEGEGDQHQHQGDEGEQPGADQGTASLAVWGFVRYNVTFV